MSIPMTFRLLSIAVSFLFAMSGFGCSSDDAPSAPVVTQESESAPVVTQESESANENSAADTAILQITAALLRAYVIEISDDKYEGRGPGSRGDAAARKYLAERMDAMGLLPGAADGSWEQPFDLIGVTSEQPGEWVFSNDEKSLTLKQWDQFIVASGVQSERAVIENAEIVFVGYGIQAPEYDWDDFKGQDLTGKEIGRAHV